jgi:hypothetical protein
MRTCARGNKYRYFPYKRIPYSGKFSLVPNFVKLLAIALEENFMVLLSVPCPRGDHTHINQPDFLQSIFSQRPIYRRKREILHHVKVSHYTIFVI